MDRLAPDVIVTQDLCAVCAVSSRELGPACPVGVSELPALKRLTDRSAPRPSRAGCDLASDRTRVHLGGLPANSPRRRLR